MAVSPPFIINEDQPAATDLISQFPANEQTFRDIVESWLSFISDPATGLIRTSALGSGGLTLVSDDAGATAGPNVEMYRNSLSPAVDDLLGNLIFSGENSTSEKIVYAGIYAKIVDPTDASEDGRLVFNNVVAGALATPLYIDTQAVFAVPLALSTPLAVASGGTGANAAAGARTNLGLGTMATQNANAVSITGGAIDGPTYVRATDLYTNQNLHSGTANLVLGAQGGAVYLRPNGAASSSGQAFVSAAGSLTVSANVVAIGGVYAGNGAALLGTNADVSGSIWSSWGSSSAFSAIGNQIESRASAYATYAIGQANAGVPSIVAGMGPNSLGSYAFARRDGAGTIGVGSTYSGSDLRWSDSAGSSGASLLPGTWMAFGTAVNGQATLFKYLG